MFARRKKLSLAARARNFLFPRGGLRRAYLYLWHRAKRISASPHAIALGFACGAFVSFTPFVGFHFLISAILAYILRGSIVASAIGTSVGNPLTFPFIWVGTYNIGSYLLGHAQRGDIHIRLPHGMWLLIFTDPGAFWDQFWGVMGPLIAPMLLGSVPLGGAIGLISYLLTRQGVERYQERRRRRLARRIMRRDGAEGSGAER